MKSNTTVSYAHRKQQPRALLLSNHPPVHPLIIWAFVSGLLALNILIIIEGFSLLVSSCKCRCEHGKWLLDRWMLQTQFIIPVTIETKHALVKLKYPIFFKSNRICLMDKQQLFDISPYVKSNISYRWHKAIEYSIKFTHTHRQHDV